MLPKKQPTMLRQPPNRLRGCRIPMLRSRKRCEDLAASGPSRRIPPHLSNNAHFPVQPEKQGGGDTNCPALCFLWLKEGSRDLHYRRCRWLKDLPVILRARGVVAEYAIS